MLHTLNMEWTGSCGICRRKQRTTPHRQCLYHCTVAPAQLRSGAVAVQAAKSLLAAGADPNAPNSRAETPLQWAAWSGSRDMVELLLENGANLHDRDNSPLGGWTPLLCAAMQVCLPFLFLQPHASGRRCPVGTGSGTVACKKGETSAQTAGLMSAVL